MAANVETMFSVRETPWHGLGTIIQDAPTSKDALILSGLDWKVRSDDVMVNGQIADGYRANVRDIDNTILGIVSSRYKIVQNDEAFSFTDALLGEGVKYETAGSLAAGKKVWMLAKLEGTKLMGEDFDNYLVFTNSHDGSGSIKVAITPVRVVCQNTLNLALHNAKRMWSCEHRGNIEDKMEEAKRTLTNAKDYMTELEHEFIELKDKNLFISDVNDLIEQLLPMNFDVEDEKNKKKIENIEELRSRLSFRFYHAPDLVSMPMNAYRFINAVSDFATHEKPKRNTQNWKDNRFINTVEGNALIDKAYKLIA